MPSSLLKREKWLVYSIVCSSEYSNLLQKHYYVQKRIQPQVIFKLPSIHANRCTCLNLARGQTTSILKGEKKNKKEKLCRAVRWTKNQRITRESASKPPFRSGSWESQKRERRAEARVTSRTRWKNEGVRKKEEWYKEHVRNNINYISNICNIFIVINRKKSCNTIVIHLK